MAIRVPEGLRELLNEDVTVIHRPRGRTMRRERDERIRGFRAPPFPEDFSVASGAAGGPIRAVAGGVRQAGWPAREQGQGVADRAAGAHRR